MGKVTIVGGKVGMEVPTLRLPSGYTELTYIQSSGTQYIDTGFKPSGNTFRVVTKFRYTVSHDGLSLFGNSTSSPFSITVYGAKPVFYVGSTSAVSCGDQTSLDTDYVLDVTANNGTLTTVWNGKEYTASYSGSLCTTRNVFVFGSNSGSIAETGNGYRLYSFQIYDNGTLVRDFTPCVDSNGNIGLYDKVESKFYGNVGTGVFKCNLDFENCTWEQVIEACQTNTVPSFWEVGDQKSMTINGIDYQIDIIGKNHDTYSSGGTAPLTFQLHDCYGTTYAMNSSATNSGGWVSSLMRSTHLSTILTLMPIEVQSGIKEVNKLTSEGNKSSAIKTSADKLFLLSEIEIFGSTNYSTAGEGTQYAYYSSGNSRIKKLNGTDMAWWMRSPCVGDTRSFSIVTGDGGRNMTDANTSYWGIPFAFCF